jgi:hypothetical protein
MIVIKLLVILGNLLFFTFLSIAIFVDGEFVDEENIYAFALLILLSLNIFFVYSHNAGNDWLTLKLKRKALEERLKIKELNEK